MKRIRGFFDIGANLVFTFYLINFYHATFVEGLFFNKHSSYIVGNNYSPYKNPFNSQSGLNCLAICKRESICLTANYNKQTKKCSLYDFKIDANSLVTQSSSIVYNIISNLYIPEYFIYFKIRTVEVLYGEANLLFIRAIRLFIDSCYIEHDHFRQINLTSVAKFASLCYTKKCYYLKRYI